MRAWFSHLDRLLRGETTQPELLREGTIDVQAGGMAVMIVLLGVIYGLCMGSYALLKELPANLATDYPRHMQLIATTVKVPALFYLTLLVTFPSLYVFNALVGSRLTLVSVLRLLIASLAVNLAVLASLGPIVLFFSLTTTSYPFIVLLNVAAFSLTGILGLAFLLQTMHRLTGPVAVPAPEPPKDADQQSPLDLPTGQSLARSTRLVFKCWILLFGVVGAQMGWVLRPFIGAPGLEFEWFRDRHSNFFLAVLHTLGNLLAGSGDW
jgi:hypothetical protein